MKFLSEKHFEAFANKKLADTRAHFLSLDKAICSKLAEHGLIHHHYIQHRILYKEPYDYAILRYWRDRDREIITLVGEWYNFSCIDISADKDGIYLGVWFGKFNKHGVDRHKVECAMKEIDDNSYTWVDEYGNTPDGDLISWLCSSSHETVYKKKLQIENGFIDENLLLKEIVKLLPLLDVLADFR